MSFFALLLLVCLIAFLILLLVFSCYSTLLIIAPNIITFRILSLVVVVMCVYSAKTQTQKNVFRHGPLKGFPKIRGTFLHAAIRRSAAFWDLH